jgi:hypothetical protein
MDILNGYFEIIPRDVFYLILQFARKRPLEDSNADECAIVRDNHHITYYRNRQLMWCVANVNPIVHVNLTPSCIVAHVLCEEAMEDRFFSRRTGRQYIRRFRTTRSKLVDRDEAVVPQRGEWWRSSGIIWAVY